MAEGFKGFKNNPGRLSQVHIEKGKKLGEGSMGDVHEAKATVKQGDHGRELNSLVVKGYKSDVNEELARTASEAALKNYGLLKDLDFPVPPTFRLDPSTHRVLMTNAEVMHPGYIGITSNDSPDAKKFMLFEMPNFEEVVEEALGYAEKAAAYGIDIGADAYSLLSPASGRGDGKWLFTDLELIEEVEDKSDSSLARVRYENIEQIQQYLYTFVVMRHVPQEQREPYLETIARIFSEKKSALGMRENAIDKDLEKFSKKA